MPFALAMLAVPLFGFGLPAALLIGAIVASHTLLAYPIAARLTITKDASLTTIVSGTLLTDTLSLAVLAAIDAAASGRRAQPSVGAFLAALTMNRLVPDQSPLMGRLRFVGSAFFVAFLLFAVGMLFDVRALLSDPRVLLLAGFLVLLVLAGNGGAALVSARILGFGGSQRWQMVGLSVPQAAAVSGTSARAQIVRVLLDEKDGYGAETLQVMLVVHARVSRIDAPLMFLGASLRGIDHPRSTQPPQLVTIFLSPVDAKPEEHLARLSEVVEVLAGAGRPAELATDRDMDELRSWCAGGEREGDTGDDVRAEADDVARGRANGEASGEGGADA